MSPRIRKEQTYQATKDEIKDTAWKQIAEFGASALSLRAIARELNITAPAIYNYYPSRDDLVTALIVDAYNSLADSQAEVLETHAAGDLSGRLSALGLGYRQWAVTHPQRYQLIFGTPIPGYHAPEQVTLPAAQRALEPLIGTMAALLAAGRLRVERLAAPPPRLEFDLLAWSQAEGGIHLEALYMALATWSHVHGLVMLEITNQMPVVFTDPGELFEREMNNILIQYLS